MELLLKDTGHRWGTEPPHPTGVRFAHNQGESAQPMPRVLVVEDDVQLVRALKINLQARTYEVEEASDSQAPPSGSPRPASRTSSCWTSACRTWTASS